MYFYFLQNIAYLSTNDNRTFVCQIGFFIFTCSAPFIYLYTDNEDSKAIFIVHKLYIILLILTHHIYYIIPVEKYLITVIIKFHKSRIHVYIITICIYIIICYECNMCHTYIYIAIILLYI